MRELLSTREVADYLRLRERKIYALVADGTIPHSRISGKLLFPRASIDEWVRRGMQGSPSHVRRDIPAVVAGSHDPLLEWAVRESRCGLAMLTYGTMDGVDRLLSGSACATAMHLPPSPSARRDAVDRAGDRAVGRDEAGDSAADGIADANVTLARERLAHLDCALVRWATREQGLVVARGNPLKIERLSDLKRRKTRVVLRQEGAGSHLLFLRLLKDAGIDSGSLNMLRAPAQTESEVAAAILDGRADAGLAVRAVAHAFHLEFVPLAVESLDLAVLRQSWFDEPMQRLLKFASGAAFRKHAKTLAGYDVGRLGEVRWNA